MTLARTPYARLSPADIGQVDRELKKIEQMSQGLYVPKVLVAARSPYAVQATDTMLLCDCTAGAITLTFPLAARVDGMAVVVIKSDTATNAVTLAGAFSGVTNPTITVAHAGFTVVAMNGAYHITALVTAPILPTETGVTSIVYPYADVRRYGVTGSGDETTKIQNAITSAVAMNLGYVDFGSLVCTMTQVHITQPYFELRGNNLNSAIIQCIGSSSAIEIGTDNGDPWSAPDYAFGIQGFSLKGIKLIYTGTQSTPLLNGLGNYQVGTIGIRDWRGGSVRLRDSYIVGFEYGFWGINSDINRWDNVAFGHNHIGAYFGPRSDQFVGTQIWTFDNDTMWRSEGAEGGRVYNWITDTDGSATTCPAELHGFDDGAGHVRKGGQWVFTDPWLENFSGDLSGIAIPAYFNIGYGDTLLHDPVVIRSPHMLSTHHSFTTERRTLYLVRADHVKCVTIDGAGGPDGAFANNIQALFQVANGGASTTVPFLRYFDTNGEDVRLVDNMSVTPVQALVIGLSGINYPVNQFGGTGAVTVSLFPGGIAPSLTATDHILISTSADFGGPAKLRMDSSDAVATGHAMQVNYGTTGPHWALNVNASQSSEGTQTDHPHELLQNNIGRFLLPSGRGATESVLKSSQVNTKIIAGANGLIIRNTADSQDNWKIDDSGNVGVRNSIGYLAGVGVGGTVTQATSKATGVTLNKACGEITMNAAALAAGAIVSFVLTDSVIKNPDALILNHVSGGTLGAYSLNARVTADGSGTIDVLNNTAGSLSEAIVIRFAIVRAQNA